jgi:lambda repressor-like predicted transcriptional regulator
MEKLALLQAANVLHAYLECSTEIQQGIRNLLEILNDPNTDEDDRDSTLMTLADALFPNPHEGKFGVDLAESERLGARRFAETRAVLEEMDREEKTFAARLREVMEREGITQEQLAAKVGVSQPAISNMLNRECRPQRRTVVRLAEALNVGPNELWAGIQAN